MSTDDTAALAARAGALLREWDGFADHRTGGDAGAAATQWLAERIAEAGGEARVDGFPFRRRVPGTAALFVGDARYDGVPAYDAPGTGADGVSAPLRALAAGQDIGWAEVSASLDTPHSRAFLAARERGAHIALVTTHPDIGRPGVAPYNAERWPAQVGPPVLQLPSSARPAIERAIAAGASARVVVEDTWEDTTAANVGCTVAGQDARLGPVVVMTPRSGWWVCTSERGGGLVLWFEALRALVAAPPRRTTLFTANTGHELGHVGLDRFLEHRGDALGRDTIWLHLGANFAARGSRVRLQTSDAELRALANEQLAGLIDDETPPATRPLGEARNVFDRGGRYISLLGSNPLFHHPDDRWPDAIDLDKTVAIAAAFLRLVRRVTG